MSQINSVDRRKLVQPAFLLVCGVLLLAAITLNGATQSLRLHFKKEPVRQPREFKELPAVMGQWLQISQDEKMDRETQDVLGTDKYLYRDYIRVDLRGSDLMLLLAHTGDAHADPKAPDAPRPAGAIADSASELADTALLNLWEKSTFEQRVAMLQEKLKDKTPTDRKQLVGLLQSERPQRFGDKEPGGVIDLGLTYYTGLVDTVAHIPDRCYIADGYEPSDSSYPTWKLGKDAAGREQPMQVRFISFDDDTGNNRVSKTVAYFFHANGKYESNPLGVRQTLQDLTQRYGYYAKIELMTVGRNPEVATATMTDFLTAAKPHIETCFPDWNKVIQAGR